MNKKVNNAFNEQVRFEYYSAYIYLGMSEWLQKHGYIGASQWMITQVREEIAHGQGLAQFVQLHDGDVEYGTIEGVTTEYDSILDVFEKALAHEQEVTERINKLAEVCEKEKDYAARIFLDWYIMEQVEEEDNQRNNIAAVKLCGDDRSALINLDKELGMRTFTWPVIPYLE